MADEEEDFINTDFNDSKPKSESPEELLENDEISDIEEGFMVGEKEECQLNQGDVLPKDDEDEDEYDKIKSKDERKVIQRN